MRILNYRFSIMKKGINEIKLGSHMQCSGRLIPLLAILFIATGFLLLTCHESLAFRNVKKNEIAPNFKLYDLKGREHELRIYQGKIVILIFIKPSQQNSINALRELCSVVHELYKSASDRVTPKALLPEGNGIKILAIVSNSFATEKAALDELSANHPDGVTILLDKDKKVYGQYGVIVVPSTAIIGKDGVMKYDYPSYDYGYERHIEGYLRVLLGKLKPDELENFVSPKIEVKNEASEQGKQHYELGHLLIKRHLPDMAIKEFRKALELDSKLSQARLELGYLLLDQKRSDEAIQEFQKMVDQGVSVSQAKVGIAIAHSQKGDTENAEKLLTDALSLNPNPVRAHYELGKIYEKKGELRKAILHYKAALEKLLEERNNGVP